MATRAHDDTQLHELLLQALETERGGIKIYTAVETAIGASRAEQARDTML